MPGQSGNYYLAIPLGNKNILYFNWDGFRIRNLRIFVCIHPIRNLRCSYSNFLEDKVSLLDVRYTPSYLFRTDGQPRLSYPCGIGFSFFLREENNFIQPARISTILACLQINFCKLSTFSTDWLNVPRSCFFLAGKIAEHRENAENLVRSVVRSFQSRIN